LPVGVNGALKVGGLVAAFNVATWLLNGFAIMNVPSARTTDCASPISLHPVGGAMQVQLFATGS
jgi:hypothetical protein